MVAHEVVQNTHIPLSGKPDADITAGTSFGRSSVHALAAFSFLPVCDSLVPLVNHSKGTGSLPRSSHPFDRAQPKVSVLSEDTLLTPLDAGPSVPIDAGPSES